MARIEPTIISNLIHNEEFIRKTAPFIQANYFSDKNERVITQTILSFFNQYNTLISNEILNIELSNRSDLNDSELLGCLDYINQLEFTESNKEWILNSTEKFCKDRAVYNAIMDSIKIFDGSNKDMLPDAIPKLLQDALAVSFDTRIGLDYIESADTRYELYHQQEEKISFNLGMLDRITDGGLSKKSFNIIMAGCVHPNTKVRVRLNEDNDTIVIRSISETEQLLQKNSVVEFDSPDGFVKVNYYIDKGEWEEYILHLESGLSIRCNINHLFETSFGWMSAQQLVGLPDIHFQTIGGLIKGRVVYTGKMIPIVDVNIEHKNHRYYTNGVSSHNTGVGKSLFLCQLAASTLMQHKNVLYITMEMAEERIAERIDANLMNTTLHDLRLVDKIFYDKKINQIAAKTHGKLIIKEYPTAGAHSGHFRALIEELKVKRNFLPDILIVDYLNICLSARIKASANANSYALIKAIAEELRGLGVEYNIPVVSATQSTRQAQNGSDMELTDVSESFGTMHISDLVLAFIRTEELDQLNQILIKQLKNRSGDITQNSRFVLGVDRSKMQLFDLEDSAQHNLMQDVSASLPSNISSIGQKRKFDNFNF